MLGLTAAGTVAGLIVASRYPAVSVQVVRWTPAVLTVVLSALALYALFLRQPAGKLAAHDAYALRTFADLYLTLPVLLASLVGLWLVARRAFWRDPALFATIAVFSCSSSSRSGSSPITSG